MIDYKYFIDTAPYIYCLEGDNSLSNKTQEFFNEIYIYQMQILQHLQLHMRST